jgi:hypothetical protein
MRCVSEKKSAIPQGSGARNFSNFNQPTVQVSGCEIKPKEENSSGGGALYRD